MHILERSSGRPSLQTLCCSQRPPVDLLQAPTVADLRIIPKTDLPRSEQAPQTRPTPQAGEGGLSLQRLDAKLRRLLDGEECPARPAPEGDPLDAARVQADVAELVAAAARAGGSAAERGAAVGETGAP